MEIIRIVAIGIVATILVIIIKQQKPEYSLMISIVASLIILGLIFTKLNDVINLINVFAEKSGINANFISIILKITGIAYITEFGSNICKDSGEGALANKIEIGGKISIIVLSIPVLMTLLDLLVSIMP